MNADIETRLTTEQNVWLATVRRDGRPHLVPIWFVWVDGAFWICTGRDSVKVANLMREPRAVLALESGNDPVVAEAIADPSVRSAPPAVVAEFRRKFDWDISGGEDDDMGPTALIRFDVRRWIAGSPT